MRFGAIIIAMLMPANVAMAQTPADKVVSVLNEVCVAPTSSEGKMAAGEAHAGREQWKLLRAEAAPAPLMRNENGVKNSYFSSWEFSLSEGSRAVLSISILRPEPPNFKYTVCVIRPDIDLDADDLVQSIDRQIGSVVTKDTSGRYKSQTSWFFVAEKARGNCGKEIVFTLNQSSNRGKPKFLAFTDFVYPGGSPMDRSTWCPD
jgi:hypothetical protein